MLQSYTAKYTKVDAGYMGQIIEWPEIVTEGKGLEECRLRLIMSVKRRDLVRYLEQNSFYLRTPRLICCC